MYVYCKRTTGSFDDSVAVCNYLVVSAFICFAFLFKFLSLFLIIIIIIIQVISASAGEAFCLYITLSNIIVNIIIHRLPSSVSSSLMLFHVRYISLKLNFNIDHLVLIRGARIIIWWWAFVFGCWWCHWWVLISGWSAIPVSKRAVSGKYKEKQNDNLVVLHKYE